MDKTFVNLASFARFVLTLPAQEKMADVFARLEAAHHIKHELQARIGDASKLPPPLAEATQAQRVRDGFSADETLKRTGAFHDSIQVVEESPRVTLIATDDEKAIYHELGTPRVPKRAPFARTMTDENEKAFALYAAAFGRIFGSRA